MSDEKELSLEDIFNEMPVETRRADDVSYMERSKVRDVAGQIRKDIAYAVNSYSQPSLNGDRLTAYGKVVLDAFFEVWVLYNATLSEEWEWDDRNRAVCAFSNEQAHRYDKDALKSNILFYELAKNIHEEMHPTLQQNVMRILYRYYSAQGKVVAHNFPYI